MNDLQNVIEVVCSGMLMQSLYILRIAIEGNDPAALADKPRGPQGKRSDIRTDVKNRPARLHRRQDRALHFRLMLAKPHARLLRKPEAH